MKNDGRTGHSVLLTMIQKRQKHVTTIFFSEKHTTCKGKKEQIKILQILKFN